MTARTYELNELSKLLKFSSAYVKMVLKKQDGYRPGEPIPEDIAAVIAAKVNRPWPPAAP